MYLWKGQKMATVEFNWGYNNNNNNNNNICLFPPFADFSELQVGSGKALTNIQLYI